MSSNPIKAHFSPSYYKQSDLETVDILFGPTTVKCDNGEVCGQAPLILILDNSGNIGSYIDHQVTIDYVITNLNGTISGLSNISDSVVLNGDYFLIHFHYSALDDNLTMPVYLLSFVTEFTFSLIIIQSIERSNFEQQADYTMQLNNPNSDDGFVEFQLVGTIIGVLTVSIMCRRKSQF